MTDSRKIRFRCPHCERSILVGARHAGKPANCPGCHSRITIPSDDEPRDSALDVEPRRSAPPDHADVDVFSAPSSGSPLANADGFDAPFALGNDDPLFAASPLDSPSAPAAPYGQPSFAAPPAAGACPKCGSPMHRGAVLCVSCGFDVRIGQRRVGEGESESVDFPVSVAARVFAALGGAFFAFFAVRVVIYASNQGASLATAILLTCFAGCAILFSLVAWRCTTRITIAKQPGIPGVATKTFKLGPIRFQRPHSLDFYDSVWFVQKPTEFTLFTVILLLLTCVGFLPGLALWIAIIRRQVVYRAELRGPGGRRRVLYFGYDDSKEKVDHLTRLVHDVSGLPLRNELGLFN